ncbi:hypothetical protein [Clostridium thermarum]|uniref:hypothetical protein n=1 Tax=Clostridium thermarum TaxID=1716543 RepID=UPI00111E6B21|nr:hypothetical protein [Clostridium thermarum]
MNKIDNKVSETQINDNSKVNIEIWEDLVRIRDLVIAIFICIFTTLGGYLIAPEEPPKPLFLGLTGAIAGFVISTILIKPKRVIKEEPQED